MVLKRCGFALGVGFLPQARYAKIVFGILTLGNKGTICTTRPKLCTNVYQALSLMGSWTPRSYRWARRTRPHAFFDEPGIFMRDEVLEFQKYFVLIEGLMLS